MSPLWYRFLPGFIRERLTGRTTLLTAMDNTGWMMGDQIARKVIGLLIGVLVARHFGPELYGEFSYAVAIVMIVSTIARLGLDEIAIRDMAKDPDTGSAEAQVALFTHRISHLTKHLHKNKKDYSTQQGLLKLVGKRKKLLNYLQKTNIERYRAILADLELRK
jgi:small subunit ribosomal protein S15